MELMLSHYKAVVEQLNDEIPFLNVYIREYGMLEFEKYAALRERNSAKRTWFFRVDFRGEDRAARYMHTFRWADRALPEHARVSLRLGREETPFTFEWLDDITRPNVPSLREIAYSPTKETFVSMNAGRHYQERKIEEIARTFFDEVMRCHFRSGTTELKPPTSITHQRGPNTMTIREDPTCRIWPGFQAKEAERRPLEGRTYVIESWRAGGDYSIMHEAERFIERKDYPYDDQGRDPPNHNPHREAR